MNTAENTAASSKLPGFVIIGAQKCGTTWLHQQLALHPQLYMPAGKDDEFFSYLPDKPVEQYAKKFIDAGPGMLAGDSCASYFWTARSGDEQPQGFNPAIPQTIERALGSGCRLIVLLKDPVARTVSAYLHHIAHGSLDCDTPITQAPTRLGLVALSRYGHHLEQWLKVFAASQILLLPDPGSADHTQLLHQCCRFLQIDEDFAFPQPDKKVFPGLRRVDDASGVWVSLGQRGVESLEKLRRPLPIMTVDGYTMVRLIHPAERQQIQHVLRQDSAHFAMQLKQYGIDTQPFEHWSTWP